jgi:hypothetical protein
MMKGNSPLRLSTFFFLTLLYSVSLNARHIAERGEEEKNGIKQTYHIKKSACPIIIDGMLNEECWKQAEVANTFYCNFPYDTGASCTRTEVRMTYDDEALYLSAVCYDTLPGDYVIQSLKRDFSYPVSDAFSLVLDPFDDKTNGFSFGVNPYGVQREGLIAGGGGMGVSTDWDNRWASEVNREKDQWTVEMKIPFKSIRFKNDVQKWGLNFTRNDLKRNESSTWSRVPRAFNISTLAFTGELVWDSPPKRKGANLSIIPFLLGQSSVNYQTDKKMVSSLNGGLDAKVAVSSSLNLDLTVNPDFSQVEVDRQVANLTRFSLFFPERRNFFIENSDLFSSFGFMQIRPFFSRRIGLQDGNLVPIIGGFRLSGKPNQDWRIGLMNMQTQGVGNEQLRLNPENFTVGAFQRRVFTRSFISGIVVNKLSLPSGAKDLGNYNTVIGLDYNLASKDNKWMGKIYYHHNLTPDKKNLAYSHASWLNYRTQRWRWMWNHEYVGKNYDPAVGFVPRNNQFDPIGNVVRRFSYWRLEPEADLYLYPKSKIINNHGPGVYVDAYFNDTLTTTDRLYQGFYNFVFQNSATARIKYNKVFTRFIFPVKISGITDIFQPGVYEYDELALSLSSNKRKKVVLLLNAAYGGFLDRRRMGSSFDISGRLQPYAIISISGSADRIYKIDGTQASNLLVLGPKVELTFTRSIFLTTFVQVNTQTQNLNINARFQWRFKPMSDLFVVYTDNYDTRIVGVKNRALVFKFVYWFNT